jgi:hypothetical protein
MPPRQPGLGRDRPEEPAGPHSRHVVFVLYLDSALITGYLENVWRDRANLRTV